MATTRPELPGFVWDEQKQRYFRIQPNHLSDSKYNQESADQAKKRAQQVEQQRRSAKRERSGIIRRNYNVNRINVLLKSRTGESGRKSAPKELGTLEVSTMGSRGAGITQNERLAAYTVHKDSIYTLTLLMSGIFAIYNSSVRPPRRIYHHPLPPGGTSSIACCLIGYDTFGLVAAVGDTLHVISTDGRPPVTTQMQFNSGTRVHCLDVNFAASVGHSVLAVAGSQGINFMQMSSVGVLSASESIVSTTREMMAVSFLDHNTIMSGERTGAVWLTDTRSGQSVERLRHPGNNYGINGLCPTKRSNEIIVSGLKGSAMYDLRFAGAPSGRGSSPAIVKYQCSQKPTGEKYGRGKALGYIREFDIAVIRTSLVESRRSSPLTFGEQLTFYHVPTGQVVPMPQHDRAQCGVLEGVHVGRIRDGSGTESVWVNTAHKIFEMSTQWSGRNSIAKPVELIGLNTDPFPGHTKVSDDIVQKYEVGNRGIHFERDWGVNVDLRTSLARGLSEMRR